MHTFIAVSFALATLTAAVPSHPIMLERNAEPGHWSYPTFSAPAVPGGPDITVTGTVQHFIAALKEANPDWTPDTTAINEIVARSTKPPSRINCDTQAYGNVSYANATTLCQTLSGIPGYASLQPGPGTCQLLSCKNNNGVGWCNDNKSVKSVYWSDLYTRCRYTEDDCNDQNSEAAGQTFYPDNTNLIIRNYPC